MNETPDTPAALITRRRCQSAELVIGPKPARLDPGQKSARLDPVVTADGQLNSLQSISPATSGGGSVMVIVEPLHGETCAALTGARCACGAQRLLEDFAFGK